MRRLFAWIAGAAGGLAAWRLLTRRPAPALEPPRAEPEPASEPGPDPRAEELRAKLAETAPPAAEEPASRPEPEPEAAPVADDPEERRRRVHEAGRAALEEMGGAE